MVWSRPTGREISIHRRLCILYRESPIKYFVPDGNTPWAAVAEGIGSFVLDAGVDFLSNWILEGQDYKSAFKNVVWGAALLDGATSAAISAFVDGAGESKAIEKIVSSSKGRKVLGIINMHGAESIQRLRRKQQNKHINSFGINKSKERNELYKIL